MSKPCHCPVRRPAGYLAPIVLGLNDALVELTGALAGFTMVLPDCRLIFLAGLTTGLAATLSMAAAEYLSLQGEGRGLVPWKGAAFTGSAYLITVVLLLLPFMLFVKPLSALIVCLLTGAFIIMIFSFFESRLRKLSFRRICAQMLIVSFGVVAISFCLSWLADKWWGIGLQL